MGRLLKRENYNLLIVDITWKPRTKARAIARSQMDQVYPGKLHKTIKAEGSF